MTLRASRREQQLERLRSSSSWKQRAWYALHTRSLTSDLRCLTSERNWLDTFTKRIPCAGCRRHWRAIIEAHPPELSSRYVYFRWTVRAHNAINTLLGKPILSFQDACSFWNYNASYDDL